EGDAVQIRYELRGHREADSIRDDLRCLFDRLSRQIACQRRDLVGDVRPEIRRRGDAAATPEVLRARTLHGLSPRSLGRREDEGPSSSLARAAPLRAQSTFHA